MASDSISKDEDCVRQADPSLSRNLSSSRLNAKAAEFVPRSADPAPTFVYHKAPATGYFHGHGHVRVAVHNQRGFTQQYVPVVQYQQHHKQHQQKQVVQQVSQGGSSKKSGGEVNKSEITDEAAQKVINQVAISRYLCVFAKIKLFNVDLRWLIVVSVLSCLICDFFCYSY